MPVQHPIIERRLFLTQYPNKCASCCLRHKSKNDAVRLKLIFKMRYRDD